jgi:hypothetical protein
VLLLVLLLLSLSLYCMVIAMGTIQLGWRLGGNNSMDSVHPFGPLRKGVEENIDIYNSLSNYNLFVS